MTNPYAPPGEQTPAYALVEANFLNAPSKAQVAFLGVFVPGLPLLLMKRFFAGTLLLLAVPTSFVFFGPFWDLVLFAGTPYGQYGFYPFIVSCVLVPAISVWHGLSVRRRLVMNQGDLDIIQHSFEK